MTLNLNLSVEINSRKELSAFKKLLSQLKIKEISQESDLKYDERPFISLINLKIASCKSLNTRRGYECFRRWWLENFDASLAVSHLSQEIADKLYSNLENDKGKDGAMKNFYINHFKAVLSYAEKCNISTPKVYIKRFAYVTNTDRNLDKIEISRIIKLWRNEILDDPLMGSRSTYALSLFLVMILLQGIAPIDIANLKISDLLFHHYVDDYGCKRECIIIDFKRRKTGKPVHLILDKELAYPLIGRFIEGKSANDYLIDCYRSGKKLTDSQRAYRLANRFHQWSEALNKIIRDRGVLMNPRGISYYFARHAYCNILDEAGVPLYLIRKMIGHQSMGVLERSYLKQLSSQDLLDISNKVSRYLTCGVEP